MYSRKPKVHRFLQEVVDNAKLVIDVGGGTPFQKGINGEVYVGKYFSVDVSDTSSPSVRGDALSLPFRDECTDGVVCKAVLEHVTDPVRAASEIHRVLKSGGLAYIWVPFLYPFHPGKEYGDYFRFTSQGVKLLFKDFSSVRIEVSAGYFSTIFSLWPQPVFVFLVLLGNYIDKLITINEQNAGWHVLITK